MEGGAYINIGGHRQLTVMLLGDDEVGIGKPTARIVVFVSQIARVREEGLEEDLLLRQTTLKFGIRGS